VLQFAPDRYQELLAAKQAQLARMLADFDPPPVEVFTSPPQGYRMRAEFRIWHEGEDLFYAMFDPRDPKTPRRVTEFPIASQRIQIAMPALREALLGEPTLRRKLFQIEFLSTLSGELLITLIYHRPLDDAWEASARGLETALDAHLIGRSRKQKRVVSRDYVEEILPLAQGHYRYRQYEGGFTQPNARVNCAMIDWACRQAAGSEGDLLELYCGNGNFTLPLAAHFGQVLATEVAKSSIRAADHNRRANGVENVAIARLSAEEMGSALAGEREFHRLRTLPRALSDYRFSTLFVDPPRAGLDAATRELVRRFDRLLYISCNPQTLARDLATVTRSHRLVAAALFDQFPYTEHMECGALLIRR
jgi:tRNA (uracil-5-)-methyltransferase